MDHQEQQQHSQKQMQQQLSLQNFDGIGFKRPADLPMPTAESYAKLQDLLVRNCETYSLLYSENLRFHNHISHGLGSAYYLGVSPAQLEQYYEHMAKSGLSWSEIPKLEITDRSWADHVAEKSRLFGYHQYYKAKFLESAEGWVPVAQKHLVKEFEDKLTREREVAINGIYGGLAHTVIYLGYAVELQNDIIGLEGITMATVGYDKFNLDKLYGRDALLVNKLDRDPVNDLSKLPANALKLLDLVTEDRRFDSGVEVMEAEDAFKFISHNQEAVAEYVNAFPITFENLDDKLRELYHAAVLVVMTTSKDENVERGAPFYSFFLLHLLTGLQSVIEIITLTSDVYNDVEEESLLHRHIDENNILLRKDDILVLVRDYWVTFIAVYIFQLRPRIDRSRTSKAIRALEAQGVAIPAAPQIWGGIYHTLFGEAGAKEITYDSHVLKCVRSLLFAQEYLKDDFEETGYDYARMAFVMARCMSDQEFVGFVRNKHLTIDIVRRTRVRL